MDYIGRNIREALRRKEMGVNQLARAAGVNAGNMSKIARGKMLVSLETLNSIAAALDTSMSELLREGSNVTPTPEGKTRVPVLDWVQAGKWTGVNPAKDGEMQEFVYIDMASSPDTFALRVRGDSMADEYKTGDMIIVDPALKPRPGDDVVAKDATGEATFKRYRELGLDERGRSVFELVPLNPVYAPRRSDREKIEIVGVVIEHRRRKRLKK